MAKEIAQEFLGIPGSEQKLNLPTHYIQNIEAALKNKKFNNKIFLEARMDIEAILRTKYVAFCNVQKYIYIFINKCTILWPVL